MTMREKEAMMGNRDMMGDKEQERSEFNQRRFDIVITSV
jgi:hypothetical protein